MKLTKRMMQKLKEYENMSKSIELMGDKVLDIVTDNWKVTPDDDNATIDRITKMMAAVAMSRAYIRKAAAMTLGPDSLRVMEEMEAAFNMDFWMNWHNDGCVCNLEHFIRNERPICNGKSKTHKND